MEIQITSTDAITTIDGTECRHWKGVTAGGVECDLFIIRIAVRDDRDSTAFEAELREMPKPSEARRVSLGDLLWKNAL
jgi:hypothetical protein